ncbi:MAG: glycosyltransferase family 2 protein, partial [Candidatus Roizmanbacteria bacterium]|nr:glycosyltransferase family 2 protein [Candidatus Roizmanbacteria bacterium]
TAYFSVVSYNEILFHSQIKYDKKLKSLKDFNLLKHFIIIPNYKEPIHKLDETIKTLTNNDYPNKENIFLVLAFEKRELQASQKNKIMITKYHNYFKEIISCYHPLKKNEEPGKASNQTYAAKIADQYVEKNNIDRKNALITVCDADSQLPKNYFSYLSFEYLRDKNRLFHFYWAPVLLYNNFWQLPFLVRIQATLSSILRLAFLSQKENLIQVSTYSTNLWMLKKINFWDIDIIPEDWHVFFQAFFTFGEKVKTIPLFTIVNGDAVYSGGTMKTFVNRYEQEKRWAWGVTDVGYVLKRFFQTPHINFWQKLKKIIFIVETHLFWPVSFFILTISASIPPLINPSFKRTVLGLLLPKLSVLILTLSSSMLILYIYLDIKLRQKVNMKTQITSLPLLIVQWYLLPLVSFFFSSLPALDAHTRILLGKKLKYKVTEKV